MRCACCARFILPRSATVAVTRWLLYTGFPVPLFAVVRFTTYPAPLLRYHSLHHVPVRFCPPHWLPLLLPPRVRYATFVCTTLPRVHLRFTCLRVVCVYYTIPVCHLVRARLQRLPHTYRFAHTLRFYHIRVYFLPGPLPLPCPGCLRLVCRLRTFTVRTLTVLPLRVRVPTPYAAAIPVILPLLLHDLPFPTGCYTFGLLDAVRSRGLHHLLQLPAITPHLLPVCVCYRQFDRAPHAFGLRRAALPRSAFPTTHPYLYPQHLPHGLPFGSWLYARHAC